MDKKRVKGFSRKDTVVVFELPARTRKILEKACRGLGIQVEEARNITDIIAIPCMLIIANPGKLTDDQLKRLYECFLELGDRDSQVIFTQAPRVPVPEGLIKSFPRMQAGWDKSLKFILLKRRSAMTRREKEHRKYDRKIFRLMHIIRALRGAKTVYTRDLCSEFRTSQRTIERDMELLQALGEGVDYDERKKAYVLAGEVL